MKFNRLSGGLMAVPLAVCLGFGAACSRQEISPPNEFSDAAKRAVVVNAAKKLSAFWNGRVPGMEDVKLVIVDGSQTGDCPDHAPTTSGGNSSYCEANSTVIITAHTINGRSKLSNIATVAHEWGHAFQANSDGLEEPTTVRQELGATCWAGVFMEDAYPKQVAAYKKTGSPPTVGDRVEFPADELHGTTAQQTAAFVQGIQTGKCDIV